MGLNFVSLNVDTLILNQRLNNVFAHTRKARRLKKIINKKLDIYQRPLIFAS